MRAPVRKMGNSSGVIIPKPVLMQIGVEAGDDLKTSRWTKDESCWLPVKRHLARVDGLKGIKTYRPGRPMTFWSGPSSAR